MEDQDKTVYETHYNNLASYGAKKSEEILKELLEKESKFQDPITQEEQNIINKYAQFLTFKAHGQGAFGSVTEYYDLYRQEKFAKKQFTDLKELKLELDIQEKLTTHYTPQELNSIIASLKRMDIKNKSLYYESGIITLNDFVEKRRIKKVYWYENEEELGCIVKQLFDLIMKLFEKNIYHSDLKLVNTIIMKDQYDRPYLKLIDMGAATFDYNYLIAITNLYFPTIDQSEITKSKESRILAEFYQLGRMIQEICLSSIYARQQSIYNMSKFFTTYNEFKSYYFENSQESIEESMLLIKDYYSENIYILINTLLGLNSNHQQIQQLIEQIPKLKYLDDIQNYIQILAEEKINDFFRNIFQKDTPSSLVDLKEEFEFYSQFEVEDEGILKTEEYLKIKYESVENCKEQMTYKFENIDINDALIFIYDAIFAAKLGHYTNSKSPFLNLLSSYGLTGCEDYIERAKQIMDHQQVDKGLRNSLFKEILLTDTIQFGFNMAQGTMEEKEQKLKTFIYIFSIDTNNEYDAILQEGLYFFHQSKLISDEDQQKLQNYIKKIDQFTEKKENQHLKIACTDIIIQMVKLHYTNLNNLLNILKNPELYENSFQLMFNPHQYTQKEIDYATKMFKENIEENRQVLIKYVSQILEDLQERQKIPGTKERVKQFIYKEVAEAAIKEAISYDFATQVRSIKDPKQLQKALDNINLALQSMNKIKPLQLICNGVYSGYYRIKYFANELEEAELILKVALKKNCTMPTFQTQPLEGKELYEKCEDFRKQIQQFKKFQDLSLMKESSKMFHPYSLQQYLPAYVTPGNGYEAEVEGEKSKLRDIFQNMYSFSEAYQKYIRQWKIHFDDKEKLQKRIEEEFLYCIQNQLDLANQKSHFTSVVFDSEGNDKENPDQNYKYMLTCWLMIYFLEELIQLSENHKQPLNYQIILKAINNIITSLSEQSDESQNDLVLLKLPHLLKAQKNSQDLENVDIEYLNGYLEKQKELQNPLKPQIHSLNLLNQWNSNNFPKKKEKTTKNSQKPQQKNVQRAESSCCTTF